MTETTSRRQTRRQTAADERIETTLGWLGNEFPGWSFEVTDARTWNQDEQPLWIAKRDGHHPQAELSAAKLHTRLTEYLDREARRRALSN